ncbi:MAG: hypothetical protein K0Q90_1605 [Paenibacillaceae bacterium]|jgi:nitroimidazol reductase NimA-like FMN-containing flavoprotein (pyridoxamine 5'-phosphate oxidase superfamily)|nr:hypothetical protein [Paenibacillaceae bacterium]
MRRDEFQVHSREEIDAFLNDASYGFLGVMGQDGWPHMKPLNFAYTGGAIYVHGSAKGEKMDDLARNSQVTFAVAKEYAIIPSTFSDSPVACPATAFFKSVHIKGTADVVTDLAEKAAALTALMEKLQPEGDYAPIDPDDPRYKQMLKAVAVVRVSIGEISAKFKFGQNLSEARREIIINRLGERGRPDDAATAGLMRAYAPPPGAEE